MHPGISSTDNEAVEFIKSRVLAVAMADSVHSRELIKGDDMRAWMQNVSACI